MSYTESVKTTDGKKIEYDSSNLLGEGGMKYVYPSIDGKTVVCIYKKQQEIVNDKVHRERLEKILTSYNPTLDKRVGDHYAKIFCWPNGIIEEPLLSITTPRYNNNFFFATGKFKGKEKNGRWFTSPKLRNMLPKSELGDLLNNLKLCTEMSRGVRKMHMMGLAHSDLSCNNILIDPVNGRAVIIDIDTLVVPGLYPPDVIGTQGYIAPEVVTTQNLPLKNSTKNLPCNKTDQHALSVLIYEILLKRHPLKGPKINSVVSTEEDDRLSMGEKSLFIEHSTDRSNRPSSDRLLEVAYQALGKYIESMFHKAFETGLHEPSSRPTASSWESALFKTTDLLIPCGNKSCEEKWFVYLDNGKSTICPYCGWKLPHPIPVFDFYYAPRRGQFIPSNHYLTAWNGRMLHMWHIFDNKQADEFTDKVALAQVVLHQRKWLLFNKGLGSLISTAGNPVPVGTYVELKNGKEIILSKHSNGQRIKIRMIS